MRAVLVMDMPRNCGRCPLRKEHQMAFSQEITVRCQLTGRMVDGVKIYGKRAIGKRPEWCPLRAMPERCEEGKAKTETVWNWFCGWNRCLDKIEGRYDEQR